MPRCSAGMWPCLAGACGCPVPIPLSLPWLPQLQMGLGAVQTPGQLTPGLSPAQPQAWGHSGLPWGHTWPWPCAAISHIARSRARWRGVSCPVTGTPRWWQWGSRAIGVPALCCAQWERGRRGSLTPLGREDNEDDNDLCITAVPTAGRKKE